MEKILKDILDGEYEKNERLDAVLADNYGIIQDTACIVCTFSLENIMKVRRKKSDYSGGIERTQSGTETVLAAS
mgnify:CR=1 FL=1